MFKREQNVWIAFSNGHKRFTGLSINSLDIHMALEKRQKNNSQIILQPLVIVKLG